MLFFQKQLVFEIYIKQKVQKYLTTKTLTYFCHIGKATGLKGIMRITV